MFGSILVLASSVARAASKYHLLLRDPHFSVIAVFVSSTDDQGGTSKDRSRKARAYVFKFLKHKFYIVKGEKRYPSGATSFPPSASSSHVTFNYRIERVEVLSRHNHFTPRYYYILTAASCAIATWSVYVVLQKSFDPGRRSSD